MRKTILLSVLLVFLAAYLPAQHGSAQQLPAGQLPEGEMLEDRPLLELESTVFDAGEVKPGSTISHTFPIHNKGRAPLEIKQVRSGCGCTVVEYDPVINPGETGSIAIVINAYEQWAGQEISKTSWAITNDPLSPQVRLTIRGQVTSVPTLLGTEE